MQRDRWRKIERICDSALSLQPGERSNYLTRECAADDELRLEVERLLARRRQADEFFAEPAKEIGAGDPLRREPGDLIPATLPSTLLHYRVLEKIGAGGMGEIFLAEDLALGRKVAMKILPEEFCEDAERTAWFEREARLLASLSHPNIATVYGFEQFDGRRLLAMELVAGDTLAERIAKGPLPVDEALEICRQMAEGLEAAHDKGIIHRDLKPANVKITPEGRVKILDFGLAKVLRPEPRDDIEQSPTISQAATRAGIIIGTAAYMSPEQAKGGLVDRRTDIWAYGCVLYECLCGRRPFRGETVTEIFAAILKETPEWAALPATTPAAVRRLLHRCLQKRPQDRMRDIGDARLEIEEALGESRESAPSAVPISGRSHLRANARPRAQPFATKRHILFALGTAALIAGIVLTTIWRMSANRKPMETIPTAAVPLTSLPGYEEDPALSPDGKQVAFVWRRRAASNVSNVYVQLVGAGDPLRLTDGEGVYSHPEWSPDGMEVAFLRRTSEGHEILAVPALSGPERLLVRSAAGPFGLDYSPDGRTIAYVDRAPPSEGPGIFLYSLETGEKRRLTTSEPIGNKNTLDVLPRFSPSGDRIAFQRVLDGSGGNGPIMVQRLGERVASTVAPGVDSSGASAYYSDFDWKEDGKAIVAATGRGQSSEPYLAEFPIRELPAGHPGEPSVPGASEPLRLPNTAGAESVSITNGRLVFSRYLEDINIWRIPGPSAPKGSTDELLIGSTRQDIAFDYSPDGSNIVFASNRTTNSWSIWICDSDGMNPRQLTDPGHWAFYPQFSPDGNRILFNGSDGYAHAVDIRGGAPVRLTSGEFGTFLPGWSEDGRSLLFGSNRAGDVSQIWRTDLDTGRMTQLTRSPGTKFRPIECRGYVYFYKPYSSFAGIRTATRAHQIFRIPSAGGTEELVVQDVPYHYWAIWQGNLVYIRYTESGDILIESMDLSTRSIRRLRELSPDTELVHQRVPYMPVSPDGRWILLTKNDRSGSDLILVENFN